MFSIVYCTHNVCELCVCQRFFNKESYNNNNNNNNNNYYYYYYYVLESVAIWRLVESSMMT